MDVIEAIKTRRSIRSYKDKPIPKEAVEKIVDIARFAPSARNTQPWEFVVITRQQMLETIGEITDNGRFIAGAKACIAVFCQDTKYYLEDGCATTVNILLAARALGIGSCWVAGDKKPYCSRITLLLDVPADYKLISLISLGYPEYEDEFKIAEKRVVKELVHWEKF